MKSAPPLRLSVSLLALVLRVSIATHGHNHGHSHHKSPPQPYLPTHPHHPSYALNPPPVEYTYVASNEYSAPYAYPTPYPYVAPYSYSIPYVPNYNEKGYAHPHSPNYREPPSYIAPTAPVAYEQPVYYKPAPTPPVYENYNTKYSAPTPPEAYRPQYDAYSTTSYYAAAPYTSYKKEYHAYTTTTVYVAPSHEPYKQEYNSYATPTYSTTTPYMPYEHEYSSYASSSYAAETYKLPNPAEPYEHNPLPYSTTANYPAYNPPAPPKEYTPNPPTYYTPTPSIDYTQNPPTYYTPVPSVYYTPAPPVNYTPAPPIYYTPTSHKEYTPAPPIYYNSAPSVDYTPAPPKEYKPVPPKEYTPAPPKEYTPTPPIYYTPAPSVDYTPVPPKEYTPAPPKEYTPTPPIYYTPTSPVKYTPAPPVNYTPTPSIYYTPVPPVNYTPALHYQDSYSSKQFYEPPTHTYTQLYSTPSGSAKCTTCRGAPKYNTPVVESVVPYIKPTYEPGYPVYQKPDNPYAPKCTWDRVQVNDPDTWTPVPSYAYSDMPQNPPAPGSIDPDIMHMVHRLSLKEKIGQMTQIQVGQLIDCNGELNRTAVEYWIGEWKVGSFLETPANHGGKYNWYSPRTFSAFTDAVQKIALERGSKIPVIWGLDSVRGANYVKGGTIFPVGIATAATFNPRFAYDAGRIAAKDTRAAGVHWAFAPVLDLAVNKLWSRTYENFGEDPYLSSQMGVASVNGYQGDYKHDRSRVAACMKHFVGYGYPFDGSDRANRHIAAHELLEYYVPSFKAAIDAGVATAMESYGVVNGEPVVMSHYYLQALLREQLGFNGMLVTDWAEINGQATNYRTADSIGQATWATLNRTSVDMSMVTDDESFAATTFELVSQGAIPESRLDESVARILQLKKDLGLFESPFADPKLQDTVGSEQDVEAARNSVRESVTLLKNANNVLPLRQSDRVLFVGPTLNSTRYMGGGWNVHWQGPTDAEGDAVYQGFGDTILQGVQRVTGVMPDYCEGVDIDGNPLVDIRIVIDAARHADKIVIGLGEKTYAEIEGSIDRLALPDGQLDLVYAIASATKKPIVVVLVEGRPRVLNNVAHVADSIVQAYLPGTYGGLPIAEILYGYVNPSGRLPYTYPSSESQASTTIWQPSYMAYNPQWAFGYGLGYSHIEYSNATASCQSLKPGSPVRVTVSITNHGPHAQLETVMLFTNQAYRFGMAPEHYRLRAFEKISLSVGETKLVTLEVKAEDLAFWDVDLRKRIEPSPVTLAINPYTQANIFTTVQLEAGAYY